MIQEVEIRRLNLIGDMDKNDVLSVEEPLEIQLALSNGNETHPLSVTMRTPGQDRELAVGFLFTEGLITGKPDLANPAFSDLEQNKLLVHLSERATFDLNQLKRNFYTTSSCGVCGKESIESIHQICRITTLGSELNVHREIIFSMPNRLREVQKNFLRTGGIHAAAFFSSEGLLRAFREDVGRHNALDKLIGSEVLKTDLDEPDLHDQVLLLSGRASFELIQKAAMAGIKIICAIGAPSSLAVETAKSFGMTLIGFLKEDSANIYCGQHRIDTD